MTFRLYGYQYGSAKRYIKAAKTYFCDSGIIHSMNTAVSEGQLFENFVLAEFGKRRKLNLIATDQFYYYKSAAGHEIDLIFEIDDTLFAIEIKATRNPGPKDFRNLRKFANNSNRPIKCILFYLGEEYDKTDCIYIIPVGALFRIALPFTIKECH